MRSTPECRVRELGGGIVHLEITVSPGQVQRALNHRLKEEQEEAEIPGFRKGKAPLKQIYLRYREQILEQVRDTVVNEAINKVMEERDDSPLTPPVPLGKEELELVEAVSPEERDEENAMLDRDACKEVRFTASYQTDPQESSQSSPTEDMARPGSPSPSPQGPESPGPDTPTPGPSGPDVPGPGN